MGFFIIFLIRFIISCLSSSISWPVSLTVVLLQPKGWRADGVRAETLCMSSLCLCGADGSEHGAGQAPRAALGIKELQILLLFESEALKIKHLVLITGTACPQQWK